jgi:hypothetical protein
LSYEAQRGMYLHPTYAVTLAREPLGVLDAWMWAREPKDAEGHRGGVLESTRWVEGYERMAELAGELAETRLVYVADREADIVALMAKARELGHAVDWLIRSRHNRALPTGGKLRVSEGEALGEFISPSPRATDKKRAPCANRCGQGMWSSPTVREVAWRPPASWPARWAPLKA